MLRIQQRKIILLISGVFGREITPKPMLHPVVLSASHTDVNALLKICILFTQDPKQQSLSSFNHSRMCLSSSHTCLLSTNQALRQLQRQVPSQLTVQQRSKQRSCHVNRNVICRLQLEPKGEKAVAPVKTRMKANSAFHAILSKINSVRLKGAEKVFL